MTGHTFNYDLLNSPNPASQISSVWRTSSVPMKEKLHGRHPTQKPLRLLRRAVLASTGEGDLLFDPFSGSGTTGVAAKELGRFFAGADKEREFAELAGRRIGAAVRGEALRELESVMRFSATRVLTSGSMYIACGVLDSSTSTHNVVVKNGSFA